MRRKTRKAIVHLSCFAAILFLVLFLNRPQTSKTFAWNKIRYETTSTTPLEARGICPGLESTSKPALVVARVVADGDSKWLDELVDSYHLCVYTADAPIDKESNYLQIPANRGHEAMAYLTFLIDNYEQIPSEGVVFVHGSRWAWHNDGPDYDNAALLAALNISSALTPLGYHNLRCDWSLSTCHPSSRPQGSLETVRVLFRFLLSSFSGETTQHMILAPPSRNGPSGSLKSINANHQLLNSLCRQYWSRGMPELCLMQPCHGLSRPCSVAVDLTLALENHFSAAPMLFAHSVALSLL